MADETPAATPAKRVKKKVPMVTTHPDQIKFEVTPDTEVPTGRARGRETLDDAQQKKIETAVETSHAQDKWLTALGVPGSQAEVVKRLRAAAAKLGYGMSIGTPTDSAKGVRVPFKAGKRRTYHRGDKRQE